MMFIQEEEEVFLQHNPQIPDIVTDRLATDTQVPTNTYRVFIKYCVFFKEFSKVCHLSLASTRLLLVVQKITSQ